MYTQKLHTIIIDAFLRRPLLQNTINAISELLIKIAEYSFPNGNTG